MTTTVRTATEARGATMHHGVRYVLAGSLVLAVVAMIVAFMVI